jgi:hypothetical protein
MIEVLLHLGFVKNPMTPKIIEKSANGIHAQAKDQHSCVKAFEDVMRETIYRFGQGK